jgi:hypothetical protein
MHQTVIDAAYLRGKAMVLRGLSATTTLSLSVELEKLAAEMEAYAVDIERRVEGASRPPKKGKRL